VVSVSLFVCLIKKLPKIDTHVERWCKRILWMKRWEQELHSEAFERKPDSLQASQLQNTCEQFFRCRWFLEVLQEYVKNNLFYVQTTIPPTDQRQKTIFDNFNKPCINNDVSKTVYNLWVSIDSILNKIQHYHTKCPSMPLYKYLVTQRESVKTLEMITRLLDVKKISVFKPIFIFGLDYLACSSLQNLLMSLTSCTAPTKKEIFSYLSTCTFIGEKTQNEKPYSFFPLLKKSTSEKSCLAESLHQFHNGDEYFGFSDNPLFEMIWHSPTQALHFKNPDDYLNWFQKNHTNMLHDKIVRLLISCRSDATSERWVFSGLHHSMYQSELAKEFPDATFIHIISDDDLTTSSTLPLWCPTSKQPLERFSAVLHHLEKKTVDFSTKVEHFHIKATDIIFYPLNVIAGLCEKLSIPTNYTDKKSLVSQTSTFIKNAQDFYKRKHFIPDSLRKTVRNFDQHIMALCKPSKITNFIKPYTPASLCLPNVSTLSENFTSEKCLNNYPEIVLQMNQLVSQLATESFLLAIKRKKFLSEIVEQIRNNVFGYHTDFMAFSKPLIDLKSLCNVLHDVIDYSTQNSFTTQVHTLLLTGPTSFLSCQVLSQILQLLALGDSNIDNRFIRSNDLSLERVVCLIPAETPTEATIKLHKMFCQFKLPWNEAQIASLRNASKLILLCGDCSSESFGFSEKATSDTIFEEGAFGSKELCESNTNYSFWCQAVDCILYIPDMTDWFLPYDFLKESYITPTFNLLKFSFTKKIKRFLTISPVDQFKVLSKTILRLTTVNFDDFIETKSNSWCQSFTNFVNCCPPSIIGYPCSVWVVEQMINYSIEQYASATKNSFSPITVCILPPIIHCSRWKSIDSCDTNLFSAIFKAYTHDNSLIDKNLVRFFSTSASTIASLLLNISLTTCKKCVSYVHLTPETDLKYLNGISSNNLSLGFHENESLTKINNLLECIKDTPWYGPLGVYILATLESTLNIVSHPTFLLFNHSVKNIENLTTLFPQYNSDLYESELPLLSYVKPKLERPNSETKIVCESNDKAIDLSSVKNLKNPIAFSMFVQYFNKNPLHQDCIRQLVTYLKSVSSTRLFLEHSLTYEIKAPVYLIGVPYSRASLLHQHLQRSRHFNCVIQTDLTQLNNKMDVQNSKTMSCLNKLMRLFNTQLELTLETENTFKSVTDELILMLTGQCSISPVILNSISCNALRNDNQDTEYKDHKRFLQKLCDKRSDDRSLHWLLHSQHDTCSISNLLKVYPDARIIFIHRDPFEFVPCWLNHLKILNQKDTLLPSDITPYIENMAKTLDKYCTKRRERQWVDISTTQLVANPHDTLKQAFVQLGLPDLIIEPQVLNSFKENAKVLQQQEQLLLEKGITKEIIALCQQSITTLFDKYKKNVNKILGKSWSQRLH
jgi:hypothetical protein